MPIMYEYLQGLRWQPLLQQSARKMMRLVIIHYDIYLMEGYVP